PPRPPFLLPIRHPPTPTLFPYTTLFRSIRRRVVSGDRELRDRRYVRSKSVRRGKWRCLIALQLHRDFRDSQFCSAMRQRHLPRRDRKSTRLNSSHVSTSYAVFCLKKKTS